MLTFVCTYFLYKHLAGISSVGERLPMGLELVETEAETHQWPQWQAVAPHVCFTWLLRVSLSISQPLHRFPQYQFPEPAVADTRTPKSCKDWWLKMQFSAVKQSSCCSRMGNSSGQISLCLVLSYKSCFGNEKTVCHDQNNTVVYFFKMKPAGKCQGS